MPLSTPVGQGTAGTVFCYDCCKAEESGDGIMIDDDYDGTRDFLAQ